jgi:DNA-binding NarL/FixJ family response regulator
MKILIIDNSVEMIGRLQEIITETLAGAIVYGALSYEAALKSFKENMPEVVLLDISLSGNRAITILKEIKEIEPSTITIVLSINTDDKIKEQCKLLSADFFLDKYYEFEKITAIINAIPEKNKE